MKIRRDKAIISLTPAATDLHAMFSGRMGCAVALAGDGTYLFEELVNSSQTQAYYPGIH
ncbi:hypothetical protein [Thermosphaera sp.]